jgi:hypothetical protein
VFAGLQMNLWSSLFIIYLCLVQREKRRIKKCLSLLPLLYLHCFFVPWRYRA